MRTRVRQAEEERDKAFDEVRLPFQSTEACAIKSPLLCPNEDCHILETGGNGRFKSSITLRQDPSPSSDNAGNFMRPDDGAHSAGT